MFRLVGASNVIRDAAPPVLVDVFGVVTVLGSGSFLVVALSLAYWNLPERRDRLLALISVAFVALAVTVTLKGGFDLPRPPADVRRHVVEPGSAGFPSGHAIAATVGYGGALVALERQRHLPSILGAGSLIAAVALSRVVLGVHYLGDVITGVAVGLVVLTALSVALAYSPEYTFGAAAILSIPALALSPGADATLALGGSVGGLCATFFRQRTASIGSRTERATVNAVGVTFLGAATVAESLAANLLPAAVAVSFLLAFGIVALPWALGDVVGVGTEPVPDR